jgi:hypothetical protein
MKKLVVDGHEAKIAVVKISFSTPLALLFLGCSKTQTFSLF